MRMLEKDPDKRYASARDLQLDLEAFARDRRLHISSAGLADWMETSFGPKREIWHSLPAAAAPPPPAPAVSEPATRIVAHVAVTKSDQATGSASGEGSATPITQSLLGRQPATPSSTRSVAVIVAGIGALAVAAALWFGRSHAAAPAAVASGGAPGTSVVMLVAERGAVAVEPGTSRPGCFCRTLRAPPPPTATAIVPPVAPAVAAPAPPRQQRGRRPAANPVAGFSAALTKHQGEIRGCFAKSPAGASATSGEISLRFEVAADGRVTSVAVLPAAIGATPLGKCLADIGARTVFAPQPAAIAFRIPLMLERRVAQESDR